MHNTSWVYSFHEDGDRRWTCFFVVEVWKIWAARRKVVVRDVEALCKLSFDVSWTVYWFFEEAEDTEFWERIELDSVCVVDEVVPTGGLDGTDDEDFFLGRDDAEGHDFLDL